MGYRPGPTLVMENPGILCGICVLFFIAALGLLGIAYLASGVTLRLLSCHRRTSRPRSHRCRE